MFLALNSIAPPPIVPARTPVLVTAILAPAPLGIEPFFSKIIESATGSSVSAIRAIASSLTKDSQLVPLLTEII